MSADVTTSTGQAREALYRAGHALVTQERLTDALAVFRTMLLLDAADPRGWLGLGASHEARGEVEKALALYELASSTCGNGAARCTVARARLLRRLGDGAAAQEAYALALEQAEAIDDDEMLIALRDEVRS